MTDYTDLSDSTIDGDSLVIQDIMFALRDNPKAITEGATGAPRNQPESMNYGAAAGDYAYQWAETSSLSTSLQKIDEYRVAIACTIRTRLVLNSVTNGTCYLRIYKNGAAFGTQRLTSSLASWEEDLSFSAGDLIQVYGYRSSGSTTGNALWCFGFTGGADEGSENVFSPLAREITYAT